jgi:glutathionylspermidine synthase
LLCCWCCWSAEPVSARRRSNAGGVHEALATDPVRHASRGDAPLSQTMQRIHIREDAALRERAGAPDPGHGGAARWAERAAYLFTTAEIDILAAATAELEQMCLQVVDRVVREGRYDLLSLPDSAAELIQESWVRQDKNLCGRFDFAFRPGEPPKLLEYNADSPTGLTESARGQRAWLEAAGLGGDQFNAIDDKLVEAWRLFGLPYRAVHFTCVRGNAGDRAMIDYLRGTAAEGGYETPFLPVDAIRWDDGQLVDSDGQPIQALFKLYPWDWLLREPLADHLAASGVQVIEPAWKMVLSSKALLPLLWGMFEGHPNLLPAAFEPVHIDGPIIRKPIHGREGANVSLLHPGEQPAQDADGPYDIEGYVYQAYAPLPVFDGNHAVVGAWVIASQPAGIGVREDDGPITGQASRFVPHLVR